MQPKPYEKPEALSQQQWMHQIAENASPAFEEAEQAFASLESHGDTTGMWNLWCAVMDGVFKSVCADAGTPHVSVISHGTP
eukprot:13603652-Alexandrium_andersonii.AAC.1